MGRSDSAPFDPEWFTKELMERGIATPEQITGCTPEEVAEVLAEKKDVSVPQAYVDFLRCAGRSAGSLFQGSDIHYPDCLGINAYAEEFARDDDPGLTTEGRFFFYVHQGYAFYFFEHGKDGVWSYVEGDGEPRKYAATFVEFLSSQLDNATRTARR
ncbi:hypothetical protein JCM3263A_30410 [Thermobifida fusca]|jgi:hypothetical protein|uniref:Knr4/Smi1-like domain-containing protein n=2 Tax=Thermobifida fusca TaxID=2021 RepID=A0A9P2TAY8_THEFU|nr:MULTISPECIES: SMI1/KNR4 family protein [Thermobifida]AAZ55041.1 hypothetical protein Tfu_1003 [Thermobifida fusca YX]EOR71889.1 hypothetical protein TM51_05432 [Thermobifida fusca TM51]MBO2528326.1 SMI1/KNR4 family protein [Thermobifida sp.]MDD6790826.1 SMI1/KNR4 family protein [Thermobifida fusca]PPS96119.1 hypothetical protein BH05_01730 [Thermobifida fusca]